MESRPYFERSPDQSLITSGLGSDGSLVVATRDAGGRYAMVYFPNAGQTGTLNLQSLNGPALAGWWFDPRDGTAHWLPSYAHYGGVIHLARRWAGLGARFGRRQRGILGPGSVIAQVFPLRNCLGVLPVAC